MWLFDRFLAKAGFGFRTFFGKTPAATELGRYAHKGCNMKDIIELAEEFQNRAWEVIRDAKIMDAWTSIGAKVNLVESLKTGLLINHLDIDFHVYTSPFILADSFKAMSMIADNRRVKRIKYANLLDTEECLEWHAWYEDPGGIVAGRHNPYPVRISVCRQGRARHRTNYRGVD